MTRSEEYIMLVERYLMRHVTYRQLEGILYPLAWYISTGRASGAFLRVLYTKKPYCIARVLMKGGSVDEAVSRLRGYVGVAS